MKQTKFKIGDLVTMPDWHKGVVVDVTCEWVRVHMVEDNWFDTTIAKLKKGWKNDK